MSKHLRTGKHLHTASICTQLAAAKQQLTLFRLPLHPCPTQPNGDGSTSTAMRVGALSLGIMSRLIQVVRMLHQVGWTMAAFRCWE